LKLTGHDGTTWKVGRVWWPERKLGRKGEDGLSATDKGDIVASGGDGGWWGDFGDADDFLAILAVIALAITLIVFLTTVILPVIAFTIELIVVILVFFFGLAGRLLFRRPWTVRARTKTQPTRRWHIVGYRNSGELRDEIAEALRTGRELPSATPLPR
jgi:hypothetical protein